MELDLLALVEQDGFRAIRTSTSRGGQHNGPCPFCGGTDRFRVQPNHGAYGWFACTQCNRRGTMVDYLMLKRGLSKRDALLQAGWRPKDGSIPQSTLPRYAQDERPRWSEPPQQWQEAATEFYQMCQRILWSKRGEQALQYLRKRGLSDQTIRGAYLGYHPTESYGPAKTWGKAVTLPQGIVIPWFFRRRMWRITIRDERVQEGPGRYKQVSGGSNGLYLADSPDKLNLHQVVLVEGEFDALSILQECRELVAVAATGTTQGSHTPGWVGLLAKQERVLVAFDAEDKGDSAAQWWLSHLDNAKRLRPWWKDANQMLQDGADLRAWVTHGLEHTLTRAPVMPVLDIPDTCATCRVHINDVEDFFYTNEGVGYCLAHFPLYAETAPESKPAGTYEQFLGVVQELTAVFPKGCTIHTDDPPGYTLAQHVERLQVEERRRYNEMFAITYQKRQKQSGRRRETCRWT